MNSNHESFRVSIHVPFLALLYNVADQQLLLTVGVNDIGKQFPESLPSTGLIADPCLQIRTIKPETYYWPV